MKRIRLNEKPGGRYFEAPTPVSCISSGCRLLDRVLGGGYAEGRYSNIVGDKSLGKTLLCIEACANFALQYLDKKKAPIRYAECEAAFDVSYAKTVGLPEDRVEMNQEGAFVDTVEAWHKDYSAFLAKCEKAKAKAGLYILDSLDSISDNAELDADFGKASFGGSKPKLIGQFFRREIRRTRALNVTLIIVSQVRDKIGVSFGDKQTRTGGKALDFYASQILWLANKGQVEETRGGVKRKVGMWVGAKCKKNKIGLAHRECDFLIRYSYGLDDFETGIEWLLTSKLGKPLGIESKESASKYLKALDKMEPSAIKAERIRFDGVIDSAWYAIEERFAPTRRKYE